MGLPEFHAADLDPNLHSVNGTLTVRKPFWRLTVMPGFQDPDITLWPVCYRSPPTDRPPDSRYKFALVDCTVGQVETTAYNTYIANERAAAFDFKRTVGADEEIGNAVIFLITCL